MVLTGLWRFGGRRAIALGLMVLLLFLELALYSPFMEKEERKTFAMPLECDHQGANLPRIS